MALRVLALIIILITGISIAYYFSSSTMNQPNLPVIQPTDLKKELVDPSLLEKGIGHRIGEFSLLNQYGETITLDSVKGRVFVAEYFFTTCGTICPKMTEQMTRVQAAFKGNDKVKILSFTVNPDYDTVEILNAYAKKYEAQEGQWHFLTGTKEDLYRLARTSFFVLKPAEATNLGDAGSDFIHTNNFVLVDQQLRIRGYYDGTDPNSVSELITAMEWLLEEKN